MTFHQGVEQPYYVIAFTDALLSLMLFMNFFFLFFFLRKGLGIYEWKNFCSYFFKINCRLIWLALIVLCEFVATPVWLIPLERVSQDFLTSPVIRSSIILLFCTNLLLLFFVFCFFYYYVIACMIKILPKGAGSTVNEGQPSCQNDG